MSIKERTVKQMRRHLRWHIFKFGNILTPFASEYRCWHFDGGNLEYTEFYIFGIRVARLRL